MRHNYIIKSLKLQEIEPGALLTVKDYLELWGLQRRKGFLVTNQIILESLSQNIFLPKEWEPFYVPPGEEAKTLKWAEMGWHALASRGFDRSSYIVALGGGTVTDLAGFIAASYMRGIPWIALPTTLMAMADSAFGGKTGVNLPCGKNLIGSIWPPKHLLIDPVCLETLPEKELSAGLAEVIKCAVISGEDFFCLLEQKETLLAEKGQRREHFRELIARSLAVKAYFVSKDLQDTKGIRAILNFGHTFAHALEGMYAFEGLNHGQAVAIGMSCAGWLGIKLKTFSYDLLQRVERLCKKAHLPTRLPKNFEWERFYAYLRKDKKADREGFTFVVPYGFGDVRLHRGISAETLRQAIELKKADEYLKIC